MMKHLCRLGRDDFLHRTRNLIDHIILHFYTCATHYVWLRAILRTFLFFPCTQADLRHIERDKAQF